MPFHYIVPSPSTALQKSLIIVGQKVGNFDRSDVQAAHPGGKVEVTERLKLAKLQFSTT